MLETKNNPRLSTDDLKISDDTSIQGISSYLKDHRIALVCGGGIAATQVPRLARELRRHGAHVQIHITENALKFIGIESLRWASQNEVVINPSGLSEHICTADTVVVAPATADLISKIKNGICCDGATTLVQSALGLKKPVIFCPTMHDSLALSPMVKENCDALKKIAGVFFIEPRQEEGKQKIPEIENLALTLCHIANKYKFNLTENILITFGGTRVMLDPVRCLTNLSTGKLGMETAKLFYGMGYNLTLLVGQTEISWTQCAGVNFHSLIDYQEMFNFAQHLHPAHYDGLIHLVAASDFFPENPASEKIASSSNKLNISLSVAPKLLSQTPLKEIKFKAAAKLTTAEGQIGREKAELLLKEYNLNAVFWSKAQDAWNKTLPHRGLFLETAGELIVAQEVVEKKQIAQCFFNSFIKYKNKEK